MIFMIVLKNIVRLFLKYIFIFYRDGADEEDRG